jgi:hypothetical protein
VIGEIIDPGSRNECTDNGVFFIVSLTFTRALLASKDFTTAVCPVTIQLNHVEQDQLVLVLGSLKYAERTVHCTEGTGFAG